MSWADWRPLVEAACDGSHHTIERVEQSLAEGRSYLLEARGCCFVVEMIEYPAEKACQVMWAAGTLQAIEAALPDLEAWALKHGCTEILEEGHAGWARVLKGHGWKPWSVTMRKPLYGGENFNGH